MQSSEGNLSSPLWTAHLYSGNGSGASRTRRRSSPSSSSGATHARSISVHRSRSELLEVVPPDRERRQFNRLHRLIRLLRFAGSPSGPGSGFAFDCCRGSPLRANLRVVSLALFDCPKRRQSSALFDIKRRFQDLSPRERRSRLKPRKLHPRRDVRAHDFTWTPASSGPRSHFPRCYRVSFPLLA